MIAIAVPISLALQPQPNVDDTPTVAIEDSGEGVTNATLAKRADWAYEGEADPDAELLLTFSIAPNNAELIFDLLHNVSDPTHPSRMQFLTPTELRDLISQPDHTATLDAWLGRSGARVVRTFTHGLHMDATATVGAWEAALNVTIGRFVGEQQRTIYRARGPPHLPPSIAPLILGISGLSHLPPRMTSARGARPRVPVVDGEAAAAQGGTGGADASAAGDGDANDANDASDASDASGHERRRLGAPWLHAEGCALSPCSTQAGSGRRLQTWMGSGQANKHICCRQASDGDSGRRLEGVAEAEAVHGGLEGVEARDEPRRLQSWMGSGQVACDSGGSGGSGSSGGSGGSGRRLDGMSYQIDPLADSAGGQGVCRDGQAINSTTIGLLRAHYQIPPNAGGYGVSEWIITPTDVPHSAADLATFQQLYGIRPHGVTDGCTNLYNDCSPEKQPSKGLESNLDVQYLSSLAPYSHVVDYYFDSHDEGCQGKAPLCWLQDVISCVSADCGGSRDDCNVTSICFGKPTASVVSISWGVPEEDLPQSQILVFNYEAIFLALLGTTVVAAAGDGGAAGIIEGIHADKSQQGCGSSYQPLFPASSPFVTSVGATQGVENGEPEMGCSAATGGGITSAGGFSMLRYPPHIFPWQNAHVQAYFDRPEGKRARRGYFYNCRKQNCFDQDSVSYDYEGGSKAQATKNHIAMHRAYPDLALAGSAVQVVSAGKVVLVDGTSASAPLFGAMVAALVAERQAAGLGANGFLTQATGNGYGDDIDAKWNATRGYKLGWLNPTLYKHASLFTDIKSGSNTDGRGYTCPSKSSFYSQQQSDMDYPDWLGSAAAGFEASAGWDPVTGLGSIDFPRLRKLFPASAVTDAGVGCIGCDYYDEYTAADSAEDQERFSPPSPPYSYG